ncbi:MAG TPA: hypothetical protein VGI03_07050 [Verrucomicrobiae bacterium]
MKQDYADLQKQLDTVKQSIAENTAVTTDAGDAADTLGKSQSVLGAEMGKSGEKISEATGHGREMFRIWGEIDRVNPVLGESLRSLVIGPFAAIAGALYLFRDAKDWIDNMNQSLDKLGEEAAISGNKMFSTLSDVRQEGIRLADQLGDKFQELSAKTESLAESTQHLLDAARSDSEFANRAIDAAADEKIEKARQLLALGLITQQQAILLEDQARADSQKALEDQKITNLKQDIATNQGALDTANKRESDLKKAATDAEQNAYGVNQSGTVVNQAAIDRQTQIANMRGERQRAEDDFETDREKLNKAQATFDARRDVNGLNKQIQEAQAAIENKNTTPQERHAYQNLIDTNQATIAGLMQSTPQGQQVRAAQDQYNKDIYAMSDQFQATLTTLERQQASAEAAYQRAQKALDDNDSSLQKFKSNIDAANDSLTALNSPAAKSATDAQHQADTTKTLADLAHAGGVPAALERDQANAKGIADKVEGGQRVTGEQGNELISFVNALGARAATLKQAADWLEKNLGNDDQILALVERIITAQNNHANLTAEQSRQLAAFEARLTALSQQIQRNQPIGSTH